MTTLNGWISRVAWAVCTFAAFLFWSAASWAHDVPNRFFDRAIQVLVDESRVYILYDLSLSELTLAEELMSLVGPGQLAGLPADRWLSRFAQEMAPLLAEGVVLTVNGKSLSLTPAGENHDVFEGHPRFRFRFVADLPEWQPGQTVRLSVEDTNFFLERGAVRLALLGVGEVQVLESSRPETVDEIAVRPDWELTPEEADELRRCEAMLVRAAAARGTSGRRAALSAVERRESPTQEPPQPFSLSGYMRTMLAASTPRTLILSLLLAFVFGIGHAFTPGHGKTVSAAFLVAGRGSVKHAVALAGTVVLTHTGSVFAVALTLAFVSPALDAWLGRSLTVLSGAFLCLIGVTLLLTRTGLVKRAARTAKSGSLTWFGVVGIGMAAGIVPCWDAVALMLWALAVRRAAWGLLLLVVFALGLATVLIAIAVAVVRVPGILATRTAPLERLGRYIAIGAAVLITAVGGWLVVSGSGVVSP